MRGRISRRDMLAMAGVAGGLVVTGGVRTVWAAQAAQRIEQLDPLLNTYLRVLPEQARDAHRGHALGKQGRQVLLPDLVRGFSAGSGVGSGSGTASGDQSTCTAG